MNKKSPYILGIVAASSGTGKTTLIEKMIPIFLRKKIRLSVIKHAHHDFDVDYPGKDSYRLRKSGAFQTLIFNDTRSALITEFDKPDNLKSMISTMNQNVDIIIIEGLRNGNFNKIEVHRASHSKEKLFLHDKNIIAVVTDKKINALIPTLQIEDTEEITDFIIGQIKNE